MLCFVFSRMLSGLFLASYSFFFSSCSFLQRSQHLIFVELHECGATHCTHTVLKQHRTLTYITKPTNRFYTHTLLVTVYISASLVHPVSITPVCIRCGSTAPKHMISACAHHSFSNTTAHHHFVFKFECCMLFFVKGNVHE